MPDLADLELAKRSDRMKASARIRDLEIELAEERAWADTMLRKIEDLEAQIDALAARQEKVLTEGAARLAELREARAQIAEQGFIIQQTQIDRDTWRSNYHEVAAQIAAKDAT